MVWRRKNEEPNPTNLVGTVKYGGGGVLVWGCMSASGLDNDPEHRALNVRLWCLYNCPQNLKTPPQSPDLNPIEHIWRELESLKGRIRSYLLFIILFITRVAEYTYRSYESFRENRGLNDEDVTGESGNLSKFLGYQFEGIFRAGDWGTRRLQPTHHHGWIFSGILDRTWEPFSPDMSRPYHLANTA
ncbi:hypothetical protein AVEN_185819-1 [Araneus ventricosus]|uniref:Tc1-like transposase DDE domain-containing protein n=1 Tax=Araneus ventricosus TaxID=182803 RepID=A0A4Y2M8Z1_ARAVE|nr:hypothetical protein AVEN_185819-1 [Araneus ventricosus]